MVQTKHLHLNTTSLFLLFGEYIYPSFSGKKSIFIMHDSSHIEVENRSEESHSKSSCFCPFFIEEVYREKAILFVYIYIHTHSFCSWSHLQCSDKNLISSLYLTFHTQFKVVVLHTLFKGNISL